MLSFIIIVLLVIIVWPLIKFGWRVYTIQRQMKQAYRAASQASRTASAQQRRQAEASRRKGGWSASRRHSKKIIDKNEGEYVAFEEVATSTVNETFTSGKGGSTRVSSDISTQISDAEWEEIK